MRYRKSLPRITFVFSSLIAFAIYWAFVQIEESKPTKWYISCAYTINVWTYQEWNVFGAVSTWEDCLLISSLLKECWNINCSKSSIKVYVNNINITGHWEYDINTNLEQEIGTEVEQYTNPNYWMGLWCKEFVPDWFDYRYWNTTANRWRWYINTGWYVTDFKPALVKLDDNKRYEYRSCWNMRYLYTGNVYIWNPNY